MTFATNMGTGIDLATSATNAINAAAALGGTQAVAAQFTFGGRTYLAINTDLAAGFIDAGGLCSTSADSPGPSPRRTSSDRLLRGK